jgi:CheY-like chemotaxis protein
VGPIQAALGTIADPILSTAPASPTGIPRPLSGKHLLVVDDNDINRELAYELLVARGAQVALAQDGAEALQVLDRETIDAVLMDCQMPVMDGYEAARAIRARPEWSGLPIIAMTASAMSSDADRARAAGMNDQITKPIDVNAMVSTLMRWCAPRDERS